MQSNYQEYLRLAIFWLTFSFFSMWGLMLLSPIDMCAIPSSQIPSGRKGSTPTTILLQTFQEIVFLLEVRGLYCTHGQSLKSVRPVRENPKWLIGKFHALLVSSHTVATYFMTSLLTQKKCTPRVALIVNISFWCFCPIKQMTSVTQVFEKIVAFKHSFWEKAPAQFVSLKCHFAQMQLSRWY